MSETVKRYPGTKRMSNMVVHGGTLMTRGITSRGQPRDIAEQTRDVLRQLDALLAEAGSNKEQLLHVMIWLADIRDFDAMNTIYDAWVAQGAQPVRACVECRLASPDLLIEIQASAALY